MGWEREGEREKIRELGLDGWEGALLVRTGGGAVGCSWRDADALQDLVFLSFLSVVFLLTISLENNEKLDLKVLLVLVNVNRVHSIARDVGGHFQGAETCSCSWEAQLRGSAVLHIVLGGILLSPDLTIFQHCPAVFSELMFSEDSLSRLIIFHCWILQPGFASENLL